DAGSDRRRDKAAARFPDESPPALAMICAERASTLPAACGSAWRPTGFQIRSILMSLVNPHALHASVRSSNLPPNRSGLTRATTISVPHSGHVDEGGAGG